MESQAASGRTLWLAAALAAAGLVLHLLWFTSLAAPPLRGPVTSWREVWSGIDALAEILPLAAIALFIWWWRRQHPAHLPPGGRVLPALVALTTALSLGVAILAAAGVFKSTLLMTTVRPDFIERRGAELVCILSLWFSRVGLLLFFVMLALRLALGKQRMGPRIDMNRHRVLVRSLIAAKGGAALLAAGTDSSDIMAVERKYGIPWHLYFAARILLTAGPPALYLGYLLVRSLRRR